MFRCSRAVFASPFRPRPSRFAAPPNVPPSSRPPCGIRPRRPGAGPAVIAAIAAGAGLAACADSASGPKQSAPETVVGPTISAAEATYDPLGIVAGPTRTDLTADTARVLQGYVKDLIGAVVNEDGSITKDGVNIGELAAADPVGPKGTTGGGGDNGGSAGGPGSSGGPGSAGGPGSSGAPAGDLAVPAAGSGPLFEVVCLVKIWRLDGVVVAREIIACWDDGTGNNGSGGGGDGGEGGRREVDFDLECDGSVTRGTHGGCRVSAPDSAGVDLATLEYEWSSTTSSSQSGKGLSAWRGTATKTTKINVDVTDPTEGIADFSDDATITVNARDWNIPRSNLSQPKYVPSLGKWGEFAFDLPRFSAADGSGPWKDDAYVKVVGWFSSFRLRLDEDLNPHTSVAYGTRDSTTQRNLKKNCAAPASLGASETVPGFNGTCGTYGQWKALAADVLNHELRHQSNYNGCADSADMEGRLDKLEGLLGRDAKDNVEGLGKEFQDKFVSAQNVGLTARRPFDAWWHAGAHWAFPTYADGHPGFWVPC